jgi:hypothetical protein
VSYEFRSPFVGQEICFLPNFGDILGKKIPLLTDPLEKLKVRYKKRTYFYGWPDDSMFI